MDNKSHESAPLVATSLREASDTMIAEGGPVYQPPAPRTLSEQTLLHCKHYKGRVLNQVDEHPFYSVGIAFGFGIFLGLLIEQPDN